jgi:hypothetical protein
MEAINAVLNWQQSEKPCVICKGEGLPNCLGCGGKGVQPPDRFPNPFRIVPPIGEDIYFCAHLRELGIPVHIDTTLKLQHLGLNPIGEEMFKLYNAGLGNFEATVQRLAELEAAVGHKVPVIGVEPTEVR